MGWCVVFVRECFVGGGGGGGKEISL